MYPLQSIIFRNVPPCRCSRALSFLQQYVKGVSHLIQSAKRSFPIPHRWVADTFTGTVTGEGVFGLCKCNCAYGSVSRGLKQSSLSREIVDKVWIESHNRIFETQWMTSGSHGKPYANWALLGAASLYAIGADGRSSVDDAVLKGVSTRLRDTLDWLFPGKKRISDEHVLSGDDSSVGEQGLSEWLW